MLQKENIITWKQDFLSRKKKNSGNTLSTFPPKMSRII